jgi:hypothetical protein
MKLLYVFCEGPTESQFCDQVLYPHLFPNHDGILKPLAVGRKNNHHVYGLGRKARYQKRRNFFVDTFNANSGPNVYFTTMLDLYALPPDFPGLDGLKKNPSHPTPYVLALEKALAEDLSHPTFIPYLQLHEFETMLLADPDAFEIAFDDCQKEIAGLKHQISLFGSVEEVNDGQHSAPSKRIIDLIPEYDGRKPSAGPDIADFIGLAAIRQKCPHVDYWLKQLESIPWLDSEQTVPKTDQPDPEKC